MSLNKLAKKAHQTSRNNGWWDVERTELEIIALIMSELGEWVQAYRKGGAVEEEMADVLIRLLDYVGRKNIDFDKVVKDKMIYNKTRGYRHGGKVA